MLPRRFLRIGRKAREVGWTLTIELNQNRRTVNAIVIDAVRVCSADPRKPGVIQVLADFIHFHARDNFMANVEAAKTGDELLRALLNIVD